MQECNNEKVCELQKLQKKMFEDTVLLKKSADAVLNIVCDRVEEPVINNKIQIPNPAPLPEFSAFALSSLSSSDFKKNLFIIKTT